jgi:hypothetical protein
MAKSRIDLGFNLDERQPTYRWRLQTITRPSKKNVSHPEIGLGLVSSRQTGWHAPDGIKEKNPETVWERIRMRIIDILPASHRT